jgi:leucyl/phenylalanyl-tRNA--protein transferase
VRTAPTQPDLPWLEPDTPLPAPERAWGPDTEAPGLLAAGADLSASRLLQAYREGIFPWFSRGQPVLWWSTDPRMVLQPAHLRLHRSLRQAIRRALRQSGLSLRVDQDFRDVMRACAGQHRPGQQGTWILPNMMTAYQDLHELGHAHCLALHQDGQLVAGLYWIDVGRAVFGESMFTTVTDGSKMALCTLALMCRRAGVGMIDCQQQTEHLAFMGAAPLPRAQFLAHIRGVRDEPPVPWATLGLYWRDLLHELVHPAPGTPP